MEKNLSAVERKLFEDYVAVVKAVIDYNGIKQYDEKKAMHLCEQLAVMTEKMLRVQEEETYCECVEDDAREQKLKEIEELRGTGIFTAEATGDVMTTIENNIDGIFRSEQLVRGITSGDVPFDIAFEFDAVKEELCNTLASHD